MRGTPLTIQRTKTTLWDPATHIKDDEYAAEYLRGALEDGDCGVIAAVLGHIARYKGMAAVAAATGMGRESLYKALSPNGNPEFATVLKVVNALGLRLSVEVVAGGSAEVPQD